MHPPGEAPALRKGPLGTEPVQGGLPGPAQQQLPTAALSPHLARLSEVQGCWLGAPATMPSWAHSRPPEGTLRPGNTFFSPLHMHTHWGPCSRPRTSSGWAGQRLQGDVHSVGGAHTSLLQEGHPSLGGQQSLPSAGPCPRLLTDASSKQTAESSWGPLRGQPLRERRKPEVWPGSRTSLFCPPAPAGATAASPGLTC